MNNEIQQATEFRTQTNRGILVGRVTNLPVARMGGGKQVVNFTIANNDSQTPMFAECAAWEMLALQAAILRKGQPVAVKYRLDVSNDKLEDGSYRKNIKLIVREIITDAAAIAALGTTNSFEVYGNLVKPAVANIVNGAVVANFTLANNGGTAEKPRATYIDCSAWADKGVTAAGLPQGQLTKVQGALDIHTYHSTKLDKNVKGVRIRVKHVEPVQKKAAETPAAELPAAA